MCHRWLVRVTTDLIAGRVIVAHRRPNKSGGGMAQKPGAEPAGLQKREKDAVRTVTKGTRLAQFLPTGKKKNHRIFWCSEKTCQVCWDAKGWRPGKDQWMKPGCS